MAFDSLFLNKFNYTDQLIQQSSVKLPDQLKLNLKYAMFHECASKYDHKELVQDCMQNNLKSLEKEIKYMQLKVVAYKNFVSANKEILSKEEQQQLNQQLLSELEKIANKFQQ